MEAIPPSGATTCGIFPFGFGGQAECAGISKPLIELFQETAGLVDLVPGNMLGGIIVILILRMVLLITHHIFPERLCGEASGNIKIMNADLLYLVRGSEQKWLIGRCSRHESQFELLIIKMKDQVFHNLVDRLTIA